MSQLDELQGICLRGVHDHEEDLPVVLIRDAGSNRLCIRAMKSGQCVGPAIDLGDLICWVKVNRPELLGVRT